MTNYELVGLHRGEQAMGEQARGRIIQGAWANQPGGERARGRKSQGANRLGVKRQRGE